METFLWSVDYFSLIHLNGVRSAVVYDAMLLCENSSHKIGFWCIKDINEQCLFSIMHNAEISLIDVDYFRKVVLKLIKKNLEARIQESESIGWC